MDMRGWYQHFNVLGPRVGISFPGVVLYFRCGLPPACRSAPPGFLGKFMSQAFGKQGSIMGISPTLPFYELYASLQQPFEVGL